MGTNKWAETELLVKYFIGTRCLGFKESSDAWIYLMNENRDVRFAESLNESSKISDCDLEILRKEVERDRLKKDLAKNAKQRINILGNNKLAISDKVAPVTDDDAGARIQTNGNVILDPFASTNATNCNVIMGPFASIDAGTETNRNVILYPFASTNATNSIAICDPFASMDTGIETYSNVTFDSLASKKADFSAHEVGPMEMIRDINLMEFSEQINKCYEEIVI